ncbi:hypothetical protein B566_EDAN013160 [Ephemera danica]|nr:hypothetical protein B566_EDAN013160 [Ephemera danica]
MVATKMSQRLKRQQSRAEDASVPSKRRKGRASPRVVEEDEACSSSGPSKSSSQHHQAPLDSGDEMEEGAGGGSMCNILFRKDLISAMKLPDSEPLATDEYWLISDPWKQEWERGVQVPVNPDSLPEPSVTVISQAERSRLSEFKL